MCQMLCSKMLQTNVFAETNNLLGEKGMNEPYQVGNHHVHKTKSWCNACAIIHETIAQLKLIVTHCRDWVTGSKSCVPVFQVKSCRQENEILDASLASKKYLRVTLAPVEELRRRKVWKDHIRCGTSFLMNFKDLCN